MYVSIFMPGARWDITKRRQSICQTHAEHLRQTWDKLSLSLPCPWIVDAAKTFSRNLIELKTWPELNAIFKHLTNVYIETKRKSGLLPNRPENMIAESCIFDCKHMGSANCMHCSDKKKKHALTLTWFTLPPKNEEIEKNIDFSFSGS